MCEAYLDFPEGWGGVWIFSGTAQACIISMGLPVNRQMAKKSTMNHKKWNMSNE